MCPSKDSPQSKVPPKVSSKNTPEWDLEETWKWIDRDVGPDFFKIGDIKDKEEFQRRLTEIPDMLKPLADTIIAAAIKTHDSKPSCLKFRCLLYLIAKELIERRCINIHLPVFHFVDGPMILPEWIVRITNGIVKWECDDSYKECGMHAGLCIFYGNHIKEGEKTDS